jgi:hypothetical protein
MRAALPTWLALLILPGLAWGQGETALGEDVTAEEAAVAPEEAQLIVTSEPAGAAIYVGSEGGGTGMHLKGVTPATIPIHSAIEEAAHRYRVTLALPGYDSYSRVVELVKGDLLNIDATLDRRTKVAYVRDGTLFVEGANGENPKALTSITSEFAWDRLSWSPDGRFLAYAEGGEIVVVDVARERRRRITDANAFAMNLGWEGPIACGSPVWGFDGRHIVFVAYGPDVTRLLAVPVRRTPDDDLPGGGATDLPGLGGSADMAIPVEIGKHYVAATAAHPTERIVAVEDEVSRLLLIRLGSDLAPLMDPPVIPASGQASWAPDGSRLVFTAVQQGSSVLYLADGLGNAPAPLVVAGASLARRPTWSYDGERIAYILQSHSDPPAPDEIHVVPVSDPALDQVVYRGRGSEFHEASVRLHGFTPDGQDVVFSLGPRREPTVYTVPIEGGEPRVLMEGAGLLTYSGGDDNALYRSLSRFLHDLGRILERGDVGRMGDLTMPVLERVASDGTLIAEEWEEQRASALARILRAVGPSGVERATTVAYPGEDERFDMVYVIGGAGRKLFLTRSDRRWYVAGYHLGD